MVPVPFLLPSGAGPGPSDRPAAAVGTPPGAAAGQTPPGSGSTGSRDSSLDALLRAVEDQPAELRDAVTSLAIRVHEMVIATRERVEAQEARIDQLQAQLEELAISRGRGAAAGAAGRRG